MASTVRHGWEHLRFESILGEHPAPVGDGVADEPSLRDLNLDQILDALVAGREEYDLAPLLHARLRDPDMVAYRHEVMRDLEDPDVAAAVRRFCLRMHQTRAALDLATSLRYPRQSQAWHLEARAIYCEAVGTLNGELTRLAPASRGLVGLGEHVAAYAASPAFSSLTADTGRMKETLGRIRYTVQIKGSRVRVDTYRGGSPDYSAEVERTFEKFRQGAVRDYLVTFRGGHEMNHVEAQILDLVVRLHPDAFRDLDEYCARHRDFVDAALGAFDREVQLFLAYLELTAPLKAAGLPFCYPRVSAQSKDVVVDEAFDLALASKLVAQGSTVVTNGLSMRGAERVIVVTGPNQGGKTTFARMFGQLHFLASLGYPVPGSAAELLLPDRIFTHFERQEDINTLRGKLEDELVRVHAILRQATSQSLVILNESLTSTTLSDAMFLGGRVMERLHELDAVVVWVTFVDELAADGGRVVSMMSTVDPDNPATRTFRIVRRPADGKAYALAIAEKYGLTRQSVRRRIGR